MKTTRNLSRKTGVQATIRFPLLVYMQIEEIAAQNGMSAKTWLQWVVLQKLEGIK